MSQRLTPQFLLEAITEIIAVNPLFKDRNIKIILIANEKAGGFTQKKKSRRYRKILHDKYLKYISMPDQIQSVETELIVTEARGHAEILAFDIVEKLVQNPPVNQLTLLLSAGGDGTSCEIQSGLFRASLRSYDHLQTVNEKICIIRLPMGTGNDGTDGHNLYQTLELLEGPLHFENARAVRIFCEKNYDLEVLSSGHAPSVYGQPNVPAPWYAFNIAGIGFDAFVCYLTNVLKSKLPGDFYKLLTNGAALIVDKYFPPQVAQIKLFDEEGQNFHTIESKFQMIVLGASGHRMFGGGQLILPYDENFFIIKKTSILNMLKHKNEFTKGTYGETGFTEKHTVARMEFFYDSDVLFEYDGETRLFAAEQSPLIVELTQPTIQVIAKG